MTDLNTVDEATFEDVVLRSDKPVLVDFWAEWCPPCHQIAPVLAQIAAERSEQMTVVKLNSDENPVISARYRVMALPTLILFHRGEMIWSVVGARPKARLQKDLDDALLRVPSAGGKQSAIHR
jgi:thioredoxin 1